MSSISVELSLMMHRVVTLEYEHKKLLAEHADLKREHAKWRELRSISIGWCDDSAWLSSVMNRKVQL